MSIVEKALEKLQRQGAGQAARVQAADEPAQAPSASPPAAIMERASAPPASHASILLDMGQLRSTGMLAPVDEERRVAAEYRHLKRPVVSRAVAGSARGDDSSAVIMVASALSGDGKTFTAFNLALSMSLERDTSVLLIDADLPKPHISGVLGLAGAKGFLDAMADPGLPVESLVHDTDRPKFQVLPAGSGSDAATEMLASQRLGDVIAELRGNDPRRIIVLDTPPLLLTTEARELGNVAGQILLVVRATATPRQAVMSALAMIGNRERVSFVLNDVDANPGDGSYYGYGYGGYGTYGSYGAPNR